MGELGEGGRREAVGDGSVFFLVPWAFLAGHLGLGPLGFNNKGALSVLLPRWSLTETGRERYKKKGRSLTG
jgi:hypothetical protein